MSFSLCKPLFKLYSEKVLQSVPQWISKLNRKCRRLEEKAGQQMDLINCPLRIQSQGNDQHYCGRATLLLVKVITEEHERFYQTKKNLSNETTYIKQLCIKSKHIFNDLLFHLLFPGKAGIDFKYLICLY